MWMDIGIRLIRKEVFTVLVMVVGLLLALGSRSGRRMGVDSVVRVSSIRVLRTIDRSITFTWICTRMSGS